MPARFVHTHLHSEYSLVDSTVRIPALVKACVQRDLPAVALTDDSHLFGMVKFYRAAIAAGIKPIIGCDIWLRGVEGATPHRLTLLCQNHAGYLNLSRLVSRAWRHGQHNGRALVEPSWLDAESDGLIALAGMHSQVAQSLRDGHDDAALAALEALAQGFEQRLYLEISRCGRTGEAEWLDGARLLAARLDLPLLASNDVRFLDAEDFEAHEARVCIHDGRVLADPKRPRNYSPEQYLKTPAAMAELFADLPEALENSVELARRCNLELSFGTYHLPDFPVPAGEDLASTIRERARAGLEQRLARNPLAAGHQRADYDQRLERELDVIIEMGFPGYFLIVSDFISWAKDHDIPVGPGRGSGAGSLVAWSLKITDLDPLQFELLFERFLNPERVSMPDFDIDFCMDKRDQVIDYVAQKYGRDHVSQIITYGSMAAKAVLRDCGRVLGMPYGQVDRIAKLIPPRPLDLTLQDALGLSEKSQKESERVVREFCELYESDDEARPLIDLALKLEGLTRNAGKHAGGVVIAPSPLTDFAPLYCEPGGEGVVTQFDKDDVEAVGLVKFDFLGLRTLTIIDWAVKAINARRSQTGEPPVDIAKLPLDDATTYDKVFKAAETVAIFQFESAGMQRLLKDAQPDRFEDIIALGALYRPGPMDLIPSFVARKQGSEPVEYPDPRVEPVLKETYGIMVYQEQVMQMAQIVGGYTLGGADLLRRAMGKKKVAEMVKHRALFAEGAAKNGLSEHQADAIFDQMEKFAGYGFNKSHAAAYALVSYQTAWLKAHYPAEFMAATLSADMDSTDKVVTFLADARAHGLEVLPPDINASGYAFEAVDARRIRYGLGAIKGAGRGACESIVAERGDGYLDLADFCRRVDSSKLNKRVLEALIMAGAMDSLGAHRAALMAQLPEAMRAAEQAARDQASGQVDIFGGPVQSAAAMVRVDVPEWPLERVLSGERETLGHFLSGHPTDPWRELLAQLTTCPIGEIAARFRPSGPMEGGRGRAAEQAWSVGGTVGLVRKRGDSMAFVQIEDATGLIEVALYREVLEDVAELLTRDTLLVIEGALGIDRFNGGIQLRARRVWTLEQACVEHARLVRLRLNGVDARLVDQLRQLVAAHRGQTPLRLLGYRNATARADIDLSEEWRVRATPQLRRAIAALPAIADSEIILGRVGG
ncbi:MAG TPA: DNA polymerase III subunit alpha [Rhodanobacteraceae bacterium]|nr:DNA polymerase III subunit alpha [Rhodanobacteraceae bacterium]